MNYLIEFAQQTCNRGILKAVWVEDLESSNCGYWKPTQAYLYCGDLRRAFKMFDQFLQEYRAVVGCHC